MCATNTRRKRAYVVAHLRYIFTMPESCGPGTNMKWQRSWIALNWHIWSANFLKTYIVMITKCFYFWQGFKEFVLTYRINYQIARCRPYCIFGSCRTWWTRVVVHRCRHKLMAFFTRLPIKMINDLRVKAMGRLQSWIRFPSHSHCQPNNIISANNEQAHSKQAICSSSTTKRRRK